MRLPGGLLEHGARRRDYAFRPVSGALELALAEAGENADSTPRAVTRALAVALERLGGGAATPERVAALCVGDRQFLMRELERHLGSAGGWFHARCRHCGEHFDFQLDYADLPVKEAGEGYPRVRVERDGRAATWRLPTGADQEILAGLPEGEATSWLARHLAEDADPPPALAAAAEAALEAMAPAIVLAIATQCPVCGGDNEVELDPYRALARRADDLLLEVHQIALHYHWSEAEILAMPQARRRRYLDLIDRARGMAS